MSMLGSACMDPPWFDSPDPDPHCSGFQVSKKCSEKQKKIISSKILYGYHKCLSSSLLKNEQKITEKLQAKSFCTQ
jgi:hypothetical protein